MRKILHLAGLLAPAFLVLIALLIAWKNITPGTYLIGWDSLHPEFNFKLAFERMFWGVWRGEQGVGAIAAHSHMADWPRVAFLWLSHFVLPMWLLRYFYIFACLAIGPVGVYFFSKYILSREKSGLLVILASFLGGAFYLLNLTVVQHFYVPFEMFTAAFAFVPWLFLLALKVLREGGKKNLIWFVIVTILSSPIAYAATLYYVYLAGLAIFLFSYVFLSGFRGVFVKRGAVIFLLTLALNSYWIGPNVYSVLNQSQIVENAKINRLFSPEASLRSRDFANLKDVLLGKSFLFSWRAYDFGKGTFADLMTPWQKHLEDPRVVQIGFLFTAFSILGAILAILKRNKIGINLALVGIFNFFFLINVNYPSPILQEALRMPFTKFSILFIFISSFFISYFLVHIFDKIRWLKIPIFVLLLSSLIYFVLPMFQGNLVYRSLERQIPSEYFQTFNWLNSNPQGRVAEIPINTLWGWSYRNWGYEGSGFLSFGISNPILDRDFDRWSPFNENFYNEASSAVYSQDLPAFEKVLDKYQVKYLLLDESVINAGGTSKLLFIPEIKKLLAASGNIKEATKFGFITIYKRDFEAEEIFSPDNLFKEPGLINLEAMLAQSKLVAREDFKENRGFAQAYNCDLNKIGSVGKANLGDKIRYTAKNGGVSCDFFDYPELTYSQGYILRVKGQNLAGRSFKIYLQNWTTNRMDVEELLPSGSFDGLYLIAPRNMKGKGYSLNLETRSFGRIASENALTAIEIYELPSTFKGASLQGEYSIQNDLQVKSVKKIGSFYQVEISGSGLLELGQGFEPGWTAFSINNQQLAINNLPHLKISGWANAWEVNSQLSINHYPLTNYVFFWPQILEWAGFVLLVLSLAVIIPCNIDF